MERETLIQRGVPAHKISVVMNVADGRIFQRNATTASANGDHFNLIYHGTFTHRYGVDLIVQAVDKMHDQLPIYVLFLWAMANIGKICCK